MLINLINLFHRSVVFNMETSQLFCSAKQMAGFYIKRNTGLKWANLKVFITNEKIYLKQS